MVLQVGFVFVLVKTITGTHTINLQSRLTPKSSYYPNNLLPHLFRVSYKMIYTSKYISTLMYFIILLKLEK